MTPLKIFIFAYWHEAGWRGFVGPTVKILDLAHNFSQSEHHVQVFLPNYDYSDTNIAFDLIKIPFIDLNVLRPISFNLMLLFSLLFNRRPKADFIYIRRGISILPALYAIFKNIPFVYEINDDPYRTSTTGGLLNRARNRVSLATDRFCIGKADLVTVISKELEQKIRHRDRKLKGTPFVVFPSGANLQLFKPLEKSACRAALALDSSKNIIAFVGTLLPHQGVEILIEAASLILQSMMDTLFIVIGEGAMKSQLVKKTIDLGLEKSFMFPGQINYEKLPLWLGAADICTAPYLKSAGLSSPVKIFDYLACARPVVASEIPNGTENFRDSGAVTLVRPNDPAELSKSIITLLKDENKMTEIGKAGRIFMEAHYDRASGAATVLAAIQDTLAKKAASDHL